MISYRSQACSQWSPPTATARTLSRVVWASTFRNVSVCDLLSIPTNLWIFALSISEFDRRVRNLGDKPTDTNHLRRARGMTKAWHLLLGHAQGPFDVFCQIYTCLQVVNTPSSTPFSLSTLHLVTSTVSALNTRLSTLGRNIEGISDDVRQICKYYEILDMPNRIKDGTIPFPENEFDLSNGISVEFKDVSFKYPDGTGQNVIKNLSFKVEQGQLCVSFALLYNVTNNPALTLPVCRL